jgi:catechol 2,3-dioxygenase-like lactoylglutathione lyase family enzyme
MKILGGYHYIPVSDLKRSAEWYSKHLGFQTVFEDPLYMELRSETGVRILLLPNEGSIHSHMNYQNGPQASHGFVVADIESAYKKLVDEGIKVTQISNYQGTSFGFYDPDGNLLELWSDYPFEL